MMRVIIQFNLLIRRFAVRFHDFETKAAGISLAIFATWKIPRLPKIPRSKISWVAVEIDLCSERDDRLIAMLLKLRVISIQRG